MKHMNAPPDVSQLPDGDLLDRLSEGYSIEERSLIAKALEWAETARRQDVLTRPRGIDVALIVQQLKVDAPTLMAALLSDPYLRDSVGDSVLLHQFGHPLAELVQKVNWLNTFDEYQKSESREPDQAELLRSMLLAVVNDVRAVLIKLAYRLQRLRLLRNSPEDPTRKTIALETLDLFTPLANRLGVGQLKWEMEDLSFRYLEPEEYRRLAQSLASNRIAREEFVRQFMIELQEKLQDAGIKARIFGRPKHLYSIHKKIERKDVNPEELYDLHAVRVIVKDIATCYTVLGLTHGAWLHIPDELDDYIANPKSNGYQSLHTVVIGPEGKPVEIQIRTEDMHNFAEFGVAAHWRYKEGSKQDLAMDRNVNTLRQLLEAPHGERGILDSFRSQFFEDDIFVLTPKGQVLRLSKGATPIDFAYGIHTEVGHRCRGAKVNGRMVTLHHTLKSGERVEILTIKQGGPSLGWIDPHTGLVKTSHARNKIRAWFRQQDHEKHIRTGKQILDHERQRLGLKELDQEQLVRHFHLPRTEDLLLAIGRGDLTLGQLAVALRPAQPIQPPSLPATDPPRRTFHSEGSHDIIIEGVRNLVTHLAQCCYPEPHMPIIGFLTSLRGIAIHRKDCINIKRLPSDKWERLMEVSWGPDPSKPFEEQ
jgi:GTP pyrophosphokinase